MIYFLVYMAIACVVCGIVYTDRHKSSWPSIRTGLLWPVAIFLIIGMIIGDKFK